MVDPPAGPLTWATKKPLRSFATKGKVSVEICGPFRSADDALSVETALISAHRPDLNVNPGRTVWRFRPLGVPKKFADRWRYWLAL
jgi:hypothetical protein